MGAASPKCGPGGLFIGFLAYGTIVMAVNEWFGGSRLRELPQRVQYYDTVSVLPIMVSYLYEVNHSAEIVCYMPILSPFVRLAGHWVDDALCFAMGWNFFLTMALNIPYAIIVLLTYWTDKVPVTAVVVVVMVIYGYGHPGLKSLNHCHNDL
ncbi:hypothetical protein BBP40_002756 [Aspergillus hancockii]|nr:hypothetical protein BBP40_002756 [Aspergillus hancockii]